MNTHLINKIENEKYCWEKTYPIKYYEMDFNKGLKPSALLNFLQDMATKNAEMLGFGPSFVFSNNYAWFLIKYRMEFDNYPCDLNELILKTEARGYSKIVAHRDFEILTTDNKRLARVASNWMLIDLETKKPLNLSKVIDYMPTFERRETDLQFNKILPLENTPETTNYEKTFEIRFDDIDVNQHVNNANYIIWAFEALPYEFRGKYKLKTLDITYKKEIAYGHNITSQVELNEEAKTSTHILRNESTQEELCLVKAAWT